MIAGTREQRKCLNVRKVTQTQARVPAAARENEPALKINDRTRTGGNHADFVAVLFVGGVVD